MAVLAMLIPPLMLGLLLALGRYEELLLAEQDTARPAPAAAPTEPVPTGSPAPSPRIPAPSIAHGSPQLLDAGPPQVLRRHDAEQQHRQAARHLTEARLPSDQPLLRPTA